MVKDSGLAGGSSDYGITKDNAAPIVKSLPTKAQGRPLLLCAELDKSLWDYINAVINTAISKLLLWGQLLVFEIMDYSENMVAT